jgi:signal transduction histidine kinase
MKLWEIVAVANALVAVAYFSIAWIISSGLVRTQQLRSNKLGLATALIFYTCGVHHGTHALHMLLPSLGIHDAKALALRQSWHWETAAWDVLTAGVGLYYLSLRGSYASVLRGAQMFEDMKVRQRQALEINDNIVQGLTVAKYQLDAGQDRHSREAIEETLRKARGLITDLLGERDSETGLGPGDLRRSTSAAVTEGQGGR